MKISFKILFSLLLTGLLAGSFTAFAQDEAKTAEFENKRNQAYSDQLEKYLRTYLVDQYDERTAKLWNRDYSSQDAFVRSVEPNRRRWETNVMKPQIGRAHV